MPALASGRQRIGEVDAVARGEQIDPGGVAVPAVMSRVVAVPIAVAVCARDTGVHQAFHGSVHGGHVVGARAVHRQDGLLAGLVSERAQCLSRPAAAFLVDDR